VISYLSIIALGFFLGMRHATDPDHVIAVTTIVTRQRKLSRAALIGAFWGVGHTLTILVVGAGIILFNLAIPTRLGLMMELAVGVMLVILGVANVTSSLRSRGQAGPGETVIHSHVHAHGDLVHEHTHAHHAHTHNHAVEGTPVAWMDKWLGGSGMYQHIRPLVVGIVHGLAGSAAVALLVLTTIHDTHWAIAYLLIFGVGTIAGMMVITMSIASALHVVGRRSQNTARWLALASGVLSLVFGLVVAWQICVVNGLFSAHPTWKPQ